MRIAGIYPQTMELDTKIQHMYGAPTGLENILAVAQEEGHEVRLFVPIMENEAGFTTIPEELFIDEIDDYAPDVAAFSLMTCQFNTGRRIARELKKRNPATVFIAGGRHPTAEPKVAEPFDAYVVGEGEETFRELLREREKDRDWSKVRGIAFKEPGGGVRLTPRRQPIDNLDSQPGALRDCRFLHQAYRGLSSPPLTAYPRYALIEYSRGCRGICSFCDAPLVWEGKVRHRTAAKVVAEMKHLVKNCGVNLCYVIDLNFTWNRSRALEFCEEIHRQDLAVAWYCMSNIETADRATLAAMKEAGCFKVAWGVESTSNASLSRMNKGFRSGATARKERALGKLELSAGLGLINSIFYIIGFPWQTEDSILEDAQQLEQYCAHQLNIGIATPFPGTQWHNEMDKRLLDENLDLYDRNHLVYKHDSLTQEKVKQLQEYVYRSFYLSRAYRDRVRSLVMKAPHMRTSFEDYFRFLDLDIEVSGGRKDGRQRWNTLNQVISGKGASHEKESES